MDREVDINILSNDTGSEDGGLVVTVTFQPQNGTLLVNANNTITYTPIGGYIGNDTFIYNVCDADGDCSMANVSLSVEAELDIPEGFSPNADGFNDYFVISNIDYFNRVSIDIFNRWGNVVYESSKYQNNWDGKTNKDVSFGRELPVGTYFYVVTIHDNGKKFSGYVYLTR